MPLRPAVLSDIPQIMDVRFSVKENRLSDPSAVTAEDCVPFLTTRGKGWVYEEESQILGFAVVDCQERNIWALFVRPEAAGKGIGRQLHDAMLNWYFAQHQETLWLGTDPGTRAEGFYRKAGWQFAGPHHHGEVKFEMTARAWKS